MSPFDTLRAWLKAMSKPTNGKRVEWLPGLDWLGSAHLAGALRAAHLRRSAQSSNSVLIQTRQPNCGAIWLPGLDSNQD